MDQGILLECDANNIVNRVHVKTEDIPLSEQTVTQVCVFVRLFPCFFVCTLINCSSNSELGRPVEDCTSGVPANSGCSVDDLLFSAVAQFKCSDSWLPDSNHFQVSYDILKSFNWLSQS